MNANHLYNQPFPNWIAVVSVIILVLALVVGPIVGLIDRRQVTTEAPKIECDMPRPWEIGNYCECAKVCEPLGVLEFQPLDRPKSKEDQRWHTLCVCQKPVEATP